MTRNLESPSGEYSVGEELHAIRLLLEQIVRKIDGDAKEDRDDLNDLDDWGPNNSLRESAAQSQRARFERLRAQGELVSAKELAALCGLGTSAISEAVKAGRMFRVKIGGDYLYPRFLSGETLDRDLLEEVCKALGPLPGPVKLHFFNTPLGPLGNLSPLEALAAGKKELVLAAADARLEM